MKTKTQNSQIKTEMPPRQSCIYELFYVFLLTTLVRFCKF